MAKTTTPALPQAINFGIGQILPATTTALVTVWTAGAEGSLLQSLGVASTDTSARDVQFYITRGGTDYLICTIAVPINSGNTNAIPSVDVMRSTNWPWLQFDMAGNKQLRLKSVDVLKFACTTTVTAAKVINCFADGEDL